ncbi:MAG TPA: hypothetical protein VM053_02870 [Gemmatimonadaceae bacterium]|nr:hypothetical protein [Gemmatimonadaceae bacterium]
MKSHILWISVLALGAGGCAAPAKVDKPRDQMTQREKDSVFAASGLPGSGVAAKAIKMADQEAARQATIDSQTGEN